MLYFVRLRRNRWDISTMYIVSHVNCVHFCQFLTKLGRGRQILVKSPYNILRKSVQWGPTYSVQIERRTGCWEGMRKMQFAFRSVLRSCLRRVHVAPVRTYHITHKVMSNTGDAVLYIIKQTMTGGRGITMDSFKLIGVSIFQIYTTELYLNLI
jgi:hypothetical protein